MLLIIAQFVLYSLIWLIIAFNKVPILSAIFVTLLIGEQIVVLSNLKMRYWFPSLPVYFAVGVFCASGSLLFLEINPVFILIFSTIFSLVIQIVLMIYVTRMENNPTFKFLNIINYANFDESTENNKIENIYKPSKTLILAVVFQTTLYFCCFFIFELILDLWFCIVPLIMAASIPIILKFKIRYWALSIGVFGFLDSILSSYGLLLNFGAQFLILPLMIVQLLAISVYSIVRLKTRYHRFLSNALNSPDEQLQKAPGQN
ncbi:MAG: hypothetical protein LBT59_09520 [Clostridiales bacterium]|nr:hypothetical protein [Clostridiales bacterium]